jgi:hypothetical protein
MITKDPRVSTEGFNWGGQSYQLVGSVYPPQWVRYGLDQPFYHALSSINPYDKVYALYK